MTEIELKYCIVDFAESCIKPKLAFKVIMFRVLIQRALRNVSDRIIERSIHLYVKGVTCPGEVYEKLRGWTAG